MTKGGLFHGKGRMTHSNGDIYQGEWQDGKACGNGVFIDQQGSMYEGQWKNDAYHGKGTEQWNYNQIIYTGDFVDGQKTGKGKFEFDGNMYTGDFVDGKFHGKGKYYFAESGKIYEGDFHENNMHGRGKLSWADNSYYEGDFKNGKMHGQGVRVYENGDMVTGHFQDDMRHGPAIVYNAKVKGERKTEFVYDKEKNMMGAAPQLDIGPPAEIDYQDPLTQSPWRNMRQKVALGTSARKKTYVGRSNLPQEVFGPQTQGR
jgi:hypothetical protein